MSNTKHTVAGISFITEDLFELSIERDSLEFIPGDCVALFNEDNQESRPYSIASGTGEPVLRFVIRAMPDGLLTTYLKRLQPGDAVTISPPFGWFRPGQDCSGSPAIFVATGTGIAPFLSYCRSFPDSPPACCLYGVRRMADAVGIAELRDRTPCHLAVSRGDIDSSDGVFRGRVTGLLNTLPLSPGSHYYLCGLDSMINDVSAWLETQGIDVYTIHRETFFNDTITHST